MHHGDVGLFASPVVVSVDDDAIDSSGLNLQRVCITLSMKTEKGRPGLEVDVLPVEEELN